MSDPSPAVLEARNVACSAEGHALRGLSQRIDASAFHLITGGPACLRGALLRVFGLLDVPASGKIFFEGCDVASLPEPERDRIRNLRCGFLFAAPFLLPTFSVIENIAMPHFKISQVNPEQARERADLLLDFAGLLADAQRPAEELAPYQQHAVSLARALANEPAVITVESLDNGLAPEDAARFSGLLRQCCTRFGVAVIGSASGNFATEPGDCVIDIAPAAALFEGKPPA